MLKQYKPGFFSLNNLSKLAAQTTKTHEPKKTKPEYKGIFRLDNLDALSVEQKIKPEKSEYTGVFRLDNLGELSVKSYEGKAFQQAETFNVSSPLETIVKEPVQEYAASFRSEHDTNDLLLAPPTESVKPAKQGFYSRLKTAVSKKKKGFYAGVKNIAIGALAVACFSSCAPGCGVKPEAPIDEGVRNVPVVVEQDVDTPVVAPEVVTTVQTPEVVVEEPVRPDYSTQSVLELRRSCVTDAHSHVVDLINADRGRYQSRNSHLNQEGKVTVQNVVNFISYTAEDQGRTAREVASDLGVSYGRVMNRLRGRGREFTRINMLPSDVSAGEWSVCEAYQERAAEVGPLVRESRLDRFNSSYNWLRRAVNRAQRGDTRYSDQALIGQYNRMQRTLDRYAQQDREGERSIVNAFDRLMDEIGHDLGECSSGCRVAAFRNGEIPAAEYLQSGSSEIQHMTEFK